MALWLGMMRLAERAGLVQVLAKLRWFRIPTQSASTLAAEGALQAGVGGTENVASGGAEEPPVHIRQPELRWCAKALLLLFAAFFIWLFFNMTFAHDRLKRGEVRAILCEQGIRGNIVEGTILSETSSNLVLRSADGVTNTISKQHPKYCPKAGDLKAQLQFEMARSAGNTNLTMIPHADEIQRYESNAVRAINTISILALPFLLAFFPLYAALR